MNDTTTMQPGSGAFRRVVAIERRRSLSWLKQLRTRQFFLRVLAASILISGSSVRGQQRITITEVGERLIPISVSGYSGETSG